MEGVVPRNPAAITRSDIKVFGFVDDDEPWPCGLSPMYERGVTQFWYTRLDVSRRVFDSLQAALRYCPRGATPRHEAQVLLALARVEQREQRQAKSMMYTLQALGVLREHPNPALAAEAWILKALLHEISEQGPEALSAVDTAGALVRAYDLSAARSTYFLRGASVNRFYGDTALALRMVDSALVAARINGRIRDETDAIFLRAILLGQSASAERIAGYRQAIVLFQATATTDGEAKMLRNIAKQYFHDGRLTRAKEALDSASVVLKRSEAEGYNIGLTRADFSDLYAAIYRARGSFDSAFANIERARRLELDYAYDNRNSEVLRLEREYDRAQAAMEIETERAESASERSNREMLTWFLAALSLFAAVLVGAVVLLVRARRQIRRDIEHQATLHDELQHRVKNNFQILISFLEIQAERTKFPQAATAFTDMARRVHNLANIHGQLYNEIGEHGAEVQEYLRYLTEAFTWLLPEAELIAVRFEGERVQLPPATLSAIGIIVNELLTNSVKHASDPLGPQLEIAIETVRVDGGFRLGYTDSGPGLPLVPTYDPGNGRTADEYSDDVRMGSFLIETMARQLDGKILPDVNRPSGFSFALFVPIAKPRLQRSAPGGAPQTPDYA